MNENFVKAITMQDGLSIRWITATIVDSEGMLWPVHLLRPFKLLKLQVTEPQLKWLFL